MTRSGFRIAALVLLAALLATNFYRAATQSIVHDEALTWQFYLSGPASSIFQHYEANNHFLATILFRISTTLFGPSEFAIRLPTVLAGAWFYWTVFRLCALVLGDGWLLLGCAALTLNPILLDFMVAARGYGLAVAGIFWALYQMLCWFQERSHGAGRAIGHARVRYRLWKAALGCCIAVATNPTFLIPVFVLAVAFCVLLMPARPTPESVGKPLAPPAATARKKGKKHKGEAASQPTRSWAPLLNFVAPVIVLAIIFLLAAPNDLATSRDFSAGTPTAIAGLRNLVNASFAYGAGSGAMHGMEEIWSDFALIVLPVMALAALIAASMTKKFWRSLPALAAFLASLAVVGSTVLLLTAHVLSGIPYPVDRTGIYFVPLTTFAALALARMLTAHSGLSRWPGLAVAILLASFAIEFAAQWNVKSFFVWRYDADTKRIFSALEVAPKPPGQIRLGVSWVLEPSLNYYRDVRGATWLSPVIRDGFDGTRQFYVATPEDQGTPLWAGLKQIYRGPVSGTALAKPQANQ